MEDISVALQAAAQYTPTSLEHGTKHFHLPPIDFLRTELFNWVDLDEKFKGIIAKNGLPEDKELVTVIDGDSMNESKPPTSSASKPASASKKAARPEVTWLRRTEYISSLRPAAAASSAANQDEAKVALSEPVDFSQILAQVQQTFVDCAEAPEMHPYKANVKLEQSFPVTFDESQSLSHCLFLGEAGKRLQERSLLQARDLKDGSGTVATLLLPEAEDSNVYGSTEDHLEFDIQRSTDDGGSGKRNFGLLLPVDGEAAGEQALLASINATFALRKRRKPRQGRHKSSKQRLQVSRQ